MSSFDSAVGWGKIAEIDWSIRPRVVRAFSDLQSALDDGPGPVIVQCGGNWLNPDGFLDIHGGTLLFFEPGTRGALLRTVFRVQGSQGDAVIRNADFAPGVLANVPDVATDAAQNGSGFQRIIYDYCRFMFSRDELWSNGFGCDYVTAMRSILAWALHDTGRSDGELHSKAGMFHHTGCAHGTIWLSALLHNYDRNYRCVGGGLYELINNLVFDWETGIFVSNGTVPGGRTMLHVIGNNYMAHPTGKRAISGQSGQNWLVHMRDNQGNFAGLPAGNLSAVPLFESQVPEELIRPSYEITAELLNEIGPKNHDALWELLIADVRTLHRGIIDSPDEIGGYPVIVAADVLDSNGDGIPDGESGTLRDYTERVLTGVAPEPETLSLFQPEEDAVYDNVIPLVAHASDGIESVDFLITGPSEEVVIHSPEREFAAHYVPPSKMKKGEFKVRATGYPQMVESQEVTCKFDRSKRDQ